MQAMHGLSLADEEEDVLLEGSPLYEYLKESCPDEQFNSFPAPLSSNAGTLPACKDRKEGGPSIKEAFKDMLQSSKNTTSRIFKCLSAGMEASDFISFMNWQALSECCSIAKVSRCLTSSDDTFLDSYVRISQKRPLLSKKQILSRLIAYTLLMCVQTMLLLCLCHSAFTKYSTEQQLVIGLIIYQYCPIAVLALVLALQVGNLIKIFKLWQESKKKIELFSQFLTVHLSFGDMLRKAILYIQEVEVIQRGYTMMTPFTPVCHLERGNQGQLHSPALRKAAFRAARSQFISLRQSMLRVLSVAPLKEEALNGVDDVYLATTDMGYLAGDTDMLTDDSLGPQPTSHLKAIANLYSDQLSELTVRYLIGQCPDLLQEPEDHSRELTVMLESITSSADQDQGDLRTSLDLHRPNSHLLTDNDNQTATTMSTEEKRREIWGPHDILTSAARALRLHAHIIAKSAETLQSAIPDKSCDRRLHEARASQLESLLSEVKGHLEACQTCVHEAGMATAKLSGRGNQRGGTRSELDTEGDKDAHMPKSCPEPIDLMAITEPEINFIDEEVFEAYIDPERDESLPDYDVNDLIEERRKRKRESEDAKRLLLELHSVLSRREEEKEKMREERRQLKEGVTAGDGVTNMEKLGEEEISGRGAEDDSVQGRTRNIENVQDMERNICQGTSSLAGGDAGVALLDGHCSNPEGATLETYKGRSDGLNNEFAHCHQSTEESRTLQNNVSPCGDQSSATSVIAQYVDDNEIPSTKAEDLAKAKNHECLLVDKCPGNQERVVLGSDSSGLGENVETIIQRPVPKPRHSLQSRHREAHDPPSGPCVINRNDSNASSSDSDPRADTAPRFGVAHPETCVSEENKDPRDLDKARSEQEDSPACSVRWGQEHMAIPFMQGLAAEAIRRSREMGSHTEVTFGDAEDTFGDETE